VFVDFLAANLLSTIEGEATEQELAG
jgi:hypothetical protein